MIYDNHEVLVYFIGGPFDLTKRRLDLGNYGDTIRMAEMFNIGHRRRGDDQMMTHAEYRLCPIRGDALVDLFVAIYTGR